MISEKHTAMRKYRLWVDLAAFIPTPLIAFSSVFQMRFCVVQSIVSTGDFPVDVPLADLTDPLNDLSRHSAANKRSIDDLDQEPGMEDLPLQPDVGSFGDDTPHTATNNKRRKVVDDRNDEEEDNEDDEDPDAVSLSFLVLFTTGWKLLDINLMESVLIETFSLVVS